MDKETPSVTDPTRRFSTRVANYTRYRPGYPSEIIPLLERECGLTPASVVADIGAGTGLLAEVFLRHGCLVYAVEPNAEMRREGERRLRGYPNYRSVRGAAEATTLPDRSANMIAAGQAFHWFDRERARREFERILRPEGWVALVWSVRREDTPFMAAYERLNQAYSTDYGQVTHRRVTEAHLREFFAPGAFRLAKFPHEQVFDYEALQGRLLSSSYIPEPGHPDHAPMLRALRALFDAHQTGGRVAFGYEAEVYYGQLKPR